MKQTPQSPVQSSSSGSKPEGRILSSKHSPDGLSQVTLDNGAFHRITVVTRTEDFHLLAGVDLAELRAHLMTRLPGHFRSK
jgi:hypothetical protein